MHFPIPLRLLACRGANSVACGGGPLQSGSKYNILQLHFHWGSDDTKGSEHTYSGKMYPIEMHIVHTRDGFDDPLNTPTGLAVTGFMFEIDSMDNAALTPLTDALANIVDSKAELPFSGSSFNINDLIGLENYKAMSSNHNHVDMAI